MNTSRRGFFTTLAAAAMGAPVDLELLAWQPGARTFFDLHRPKQLGISIRMIRNYDIVKDLCPARIDVIYPSIYAGRSGQAIAALLEQSPEEKFARQLAASEGFVLTETMPFAEFKRRWGFVPPMAAKVDPEWL